MRPASSTPVNKEPVIGGGGVGGLNKLSVQMNVQPRQEDVRDGAKLLDFLRGRAPAQTVPPDFLPGQV